MTPEERLSQTQQFLTYYVNGAAALKGIDTSVFPGASTHPGIVFRKPAALDIRPEYTDRLAAADGKPFDTGEEGPEGPGPYLFLDRCPLRKVVVTPEGAEVFAELVFVTQYAAGKFKDEHPEVDSPVPPDKLNVEVRLPSDSLHDIAVECMSQLEDFLGQDDNATNTVGYRITVLTLDELETIEREEAKAAAEPGRGTP